MKHHCLILSVFFFLVAFTPPMSAQDSTGIEGEEYYYFDDTEMISGAARKEQPVMESPSTISVITSEEIAAMGARNLPELLRFMVGTYIHGISITPRNLVWYDTNNRRILLLLDGKPIHDLYLGSFYAGFQISLEKLKRIEIIRSPVTTLYGANALGGIINLVTRSGQDFQKVSQNLRFGDQEQSSVNAQFGTSTNAYKYLFSASRSSSHGDDSINPNDDTAHLDLYQKMEFQNLELTVSGLYQRIEQEIPGNLRLPTPEDNVDNTLALLDTQWNHTLASWLRLAVRLSLSAKDTTRNAFVRKEEGDGFQFEQKTFQYGQTIWSGETTCSILPRQGHSILLGLEGRWNETEEKDPGNVYRRHTLSGFIHDEISLRENVLFNLGVRYEALDDFGEKISPAFSVIYFLNDISAFKLGYGKAYRIPEDFELKIAQPIGPIILQENPDLQPETSDTIEFGFFQNLIAYNYATTINIFYTRLLDHIAVRGVPNTNFYRPDNFGRVRIYGSEFEVKRKFGNVFEHPGSLVCFLNYTLQKTNEEDTDKPLTYSPQHKINAGLIYRPSLPYRFTALGHWVDEQETDPESIISGPIESYLTVDVSAFWQVKPFVELSASVYNVFDEFYYERRDSPANGRSFLLGIHFTF